MNTNQYQENGEYEFSARYDYLAELAAEHFDPYAADGEFDDLVGPPSPHNLMCIDVGFDPFDDIPF